MMKTSFWFLLFLSVAVLAFAGDSYSEGRVSVVLPPGGPPGLSTNSASVQRALQAADSVLLPAGFVRGQISPTGAGQIADYTRDISVGSPTACRVYLRNDGVVFSFIDSRIPHPSPATVQLSQQLADVLRARFGAAAVEIELK